MGQRHNLVVHCLLGTLEGRVRNIFKKLVPQVGEIGTKKWKYTVSLDYVCFNEEGLQEEHVCPGRAQVVGGRSESRGS